MATNWIRKIGVFFPDQSTLSRCHSETDCNITILIEQRLNRMNFSTLCTILVTFFPETPEFTLLRIAHFAAIRQKSAYHRKYFRMSKTYLDLLYRFYRRISGMIKPIFVGWSPKWRWCGNQLNLGNVRRHRQERPLLFASAFDNAKEPKSHDVPIPITNYPNPIKSQSVAFKSNHCLNLNRILKINQSRFKYNRDLIVPITAPKSDDMAAGGSIWGLHWLGRVA